jgi:NADH-quinone oxidoreductase subunit G
MAMVTIDGKELEVADGTLVLEAALNQGISIPTFCYQERLAPLASCRMCLVEIEGQGKLQPACATRVADGMMVRTDTTLVAQTRESMLEMLLANHPLDCPICDKAGECELQDQVVAYGAGESRFRDEKRVFRTKDIQLNSVIVFNANRCIQCQRCVRICDEVVGAVALGTIEKGMDTEVTGFENSLAGCDHCGNCIEVCPVGALMSAPYRYKARPWDLTETDTVCHFCGTGCQLTVGMRDGHLARVRSKYETGVNGETLCVKGRFGFDVIDGEHRIKHPMVRKNGSLVTVSWQEAVGHLVERIKGAVEGNGARIGGLASPRLSNETLYLFQKLMRSVFRTNSVDSSSRWATSSPSVPGPYEALSAVFDGLYARRPLEEALEADCILIVGSNVTDDNPVTDYLVRGVVRNRRNKLFTVSARPSRLDAEGAAFLRLRPGEEACLFAALLDGLVEDDATTTNSAAPAWREFLAAAIPSFVSANTVTILIGTDLLRAPQAASAISWLGQFCRSLETLGKQIGVQFLFDRPNQMGAWEMGGLPNMLPGWRPVDDGRSRAVFEHAWGTSLPFHRGADFGRMLAQCEAGKMDALYVVGSDPLLSYPDGALVESALSKVGLLVVQDAYLSETASLADVVLPAANFVEEQGTVTNNEGKVQMAREVRPPAFEAMRNGEIFASIASAMGRSLGPTAVAQVFAEITRLVPSYRGLRFEALDGAGAFTVPAQDAAHIDPVDVPVPTPRRAEGFALVTGDCMFHSGYLSRHSANLEMLSAEPYIEMSPRDGHELGLTEQASVTVKSHHGEARVRLKFNKRFPDGVVFIPENFADLRLNRLLKQGEYPCQVEIFGD